MKTKSTLALWFIILYICPKAQITFIKYYDRGSTYQFGLAVKQCFDGGYILTGYTDPRSGLLIRTNMLGETLWSRTFGAEICGFDVIQTPDSNFVICGFQNTWVPYVHLIKIDDQGDTLWTSSPCLDWGQAMLQESDGTLIIAGLSLVKTDSLGMNLWCKDLGFQAMYLIQAADSNFVIAGCGYGSNDRLMYLEKTDRDGDLIWKKSFKGSYFNISNNILTQTIDGGYIFVARDPENGQLKLIKTDGDGDSLWTRKVQGFVGTCIIQTRDGGYTIGGYPTSDNELIFLLKTGANGDIQWTSNFGLAFNDHVNSIRQTTDGGYIITGESTRNSMGDYDAFLAKTDSLGNILTTGTSEIAQDCKVAIYPNPFNISASIQFNKLITDADLTLYNLYGQVVKSITHISAQDVEITRESLLPGLYFVSVTQDHKVIANGKIVITDH